MIGAEIERHGIPTISISLLKEVTSVIKQPRALFTPYPLGYPLGEPNNPETQKNIIEAALSLLTRTDTPIFEEYSPKTAG